MLNAAEGFAGSPCAAKEALAALKPHLNRAFPDPLIAILRYEESPMLKITMRKPSAFNEAKPRTPKGEARQREVKALKLMQELSDICDENEFKNILAERFGIVPGHPQYENAMATWKEVQRGKP
jgi:hypothetical protein